MAEEKEQKEQKEEKTGKPSFKTAEELTTFLTDMQGQMATMQQTIDKLSPVEQNAGGEQKDEKEGKEEKEPTKEEINEIDQLLQSE